MSERSIPWDLGEAYRLRGSAADPEERDFYQEQVSHLRGEEYHARGIHTESSARRRERQRDIKLSREVFSLGVAEIVASPAWRA